MEKFAYEDSVRQKLQNLFDLQDKKTHDNQEFEKQLV